MNFKSFLDLKNQPYLKILPLRYEGFKLNQMVAVPTADKIKVYQQFGSESKRLRSGNFLVGWGPLSVRGGEIILPSTAELALLCARSSLLESRCLLKGVYHL